MRKFIIADNQDITKAGMMFLLSSQKDTALLLEADNKAELVQQLRLHPQAVVILDYTLFDFSGADELIVLHERFKEADWLLFSDELSMEFLRQVLFSSMAFGVVLKDNSKEEILSALQCASRKERFICNHVSNLLLSGSNASPVRHTLKDDLLTPAERSVLKEIALGKTTKEIAAGVTDTEQKVEQIILEVTEQCNFRCKYCVYSEDFSGNRDFGNRRMPTEIAFKAIDWALENSGAKLAITFYGGEPLLNFKLMKAVIERSQAKRGNKEIVYSFTSNMSLMTREIATYLAQVPNLYIMASIDGPRTVHDAYRVYANDAPTFEDSIGGLRILADAYAGSHMPVNINAVLTPPFGFEKLEQVNAYFESLDWLPATCHVNITYPSYGTCPGLDEYYDKITGNPKYALHGMCNPLMIWQQRKAETDGLDAYKARNIYYHSIFDDLVKINNRIIVDEPTLRRGLNGCVPV